MCESCGNNKEHKEWVCLHSHSEHSILDGYARIKDYVKEASERGAAGFGLTDHGTCSGLFEMIKECNEKGIQPVPGCEVYVAPIQPKGAKLQEKFFYGPNGVKAPKYDVGGNGAYLHLTLFAYNKKGLENIIKLQSMAWDVENYYQKPRIDNDMLFAHSEGIIVTTGCPSSEVSTRFLLGQDDKAYEYASRLKSVFGKNMYVEVMDHSMQNEDMERILLPKLVQMSKDLDIPLLATNDCHYVYKEDALAHEQTLAMQTKVTMKEKTYAEGGKRFAFSGPEYHMKTDSEMRALFPEDKYPNAVDNTNLVVEQCEPFTLDYDPHLRPEIELPEGVSAVQHLKNLIENGFDLKRGHESDEIKKESMRRIKEEFEVIHSNDFISYFLVVEDYIRWAHDNGITTGKGRGSVGGSEIAYVLDISDTDPIRFGLLFERFLSPGRGSLYSLTFENGEVHEDVQVSDKKSIINKKGEKKVVYVHELESGDTIITDDGKEMKLLLSKVTKPGSPPDVDTDFHTVGRAKVIEYCSQKYGHENVSNIITFGTFKAKNSFKSMCTIYNIPFAEANTITKTIPDGQDGKEPTINELYDEESIWYESGADFRTALESSNMNEIIDYAKPLQGRIKSTGVHPCGVIISNRPLTDTIPTQIRQKDNLLVTQWTYKQCESIGLIKMDFLGLDTIDIVEGALENIRRNGKEVPNLKEIVRGEMDDKKTYEMLAEGNSVGVFQLSSTGMQQLLKRVAPTEFLDIAATTALFRPGPMKMQAHNMYADRKNGREKVSFIRPSFSGTKVEEILTETYGLIVYQEQCMKIASEFAGMTPYESDRLRKAIGKKDTKLMAQLRPKFMEGVLAQGINEDDATLLWETIEVFGEYGFNKSHTISYAMAAYETAYLKANYTSEFMASIIQQNTDDDDKLRELIQETTRLGLKIGSVDINKSYSSMSSLENEEFDIIYGFSGVKQVSVELSEAIVSERTKNGLFKSVHDFVERMANTVKFNAGALRSLAHAGAFDSLGATRSGVFAKAKQLIDLAQKTSNEPMDLFAMMGMEESNNVLSSVDVNQTEYSYIERIKNEANAIGIFISGHPTDNIGVMARQYKPVSISDINTKNIRGEVNIIGTFTDLKIKAKKNANRSFSVRFDDGKDSFDAFLPNDIVTRLEKGYEMIRIRELKEEGKPFEIGSTSSNPQNIIRWYNDPNIKPIRPLELNDLYIIKVKKQFRGGDGKLVITNLQKLRTDENGALPYEIYLPTMEQALDVNEMLDRHKGDTPIFAFRFDKRKMFLDKKVNITRDFIIEMENIIGVENIKAKEL